MRGLVALIAVGVLASASYADIYTGSLSTADGGLIGTGDWASTPTSFSWHIDTSYAPGLVRYSYTMTLGGSDSNGISHLILETSDGFTAQDIGLITGRYEGIGVQNANAGSPNMPEDVYGIKFDAGDTRTLSIVFDSPRLPVWGDFYAKGGRHNEIWNSGFGEDPLDAASIFMAGHILRPDTSVSNEPEYGTLVIHKFHDLNQNGLWDTDSEDLLDGFHIDAAGTLTYHGTTVDGVITHTLPAGFYTLTELMNPSWTFTGSYWSGPNDQGGSGGNPLTVEIFNNGTTNAYFGNVPEPATMALLAVGGLAMLRRHRR